MSDLIDRQQAIDALAEDMPSAYTLDGSHPADEGIFMAQEIYADCIQTLKELPSAEPKKGKWIKTARWGRVYYCDQCRNYLDFDGVNAGRGSTNFCPNCGAKMEATE